VRDSRGHAVSGNPPKPSAAARSSASQRNLAGVTPTKASMLSHPGGGRGARTGQAAGVQSPARIGPPPAVPLNGGVLEGRGNAGAGRLSSLGSREAAVGKKEKDSAEETGERGRGSGGLECFGRRLQMFVLLFAGALALFLIAASFKLVDVDTAKIWEDLVRMGRPDAPSEKPAGRGVRAVLGGMVRGVAQALSVPAAAFRRVVARGAGSQGGGTRQGGGATKDVATPEGRVSQSAALAVGTPDMSKGGGGGGWDLPGGELVIPDGEGEGPAEGPVADQVAIPASFPYPRLKRSAILEPQAND
jgi:hypothetical protein